MIKTHIHNGHGTDSPLFTVYLCAMRGPKAEKFTIRHTDSDAAVNAVLAETGAPFAAFEAVYLEDVTPRVSGKYGAPMGRAGRGMISCDDTQHYRARKIPLDSGGYDKGGAYWGLRFGATSLYCVQDSDGNHVFVDATSRADAIATATE